MPTVKEHIRKAEYNEKFFDDIRDNYPDWAITGLFYSALHYVDAYLKSKQISVEDHKTRSWFINTTKQLKSIYSEYRAMYDYSVNARYKMWIVNEESLDDIYKTFYLPIKKHLKELLKKEIKPKKSPRKKKK